MDRKRKRQSGVEFWTASKCQRLLRPITSRIAPLRRNQYTLNTEISHKDLEDQPKSELPSKNPSLAADVRPGTTFSDPTWIPSDQSKNCQLKKYSVRHRTAHTSSGQVSSPQACLVSLPTPFKARASKRGTPIKQAFSSLDTSSSPCVVRRLPPAKKERQRKDHFTRAPTAQQSVELQGRQNYERTFELHQGVTDGFSLLLQRTTFTDPDNLQRKGASSLLSMCIRKVPDYIQAEEDWRRSIDEDDDTDVSAEVYEELEDLGSVQGHGWSGLREVVIAHGLSLIHEIIKNKLVATETRAELARIPAKYGLHRASEVLLLAYTQSLPLKRPLSVDSRLFDGCLSGLTTMQSVSAQNEVFVRILDVLFTSGRLNLSWLAARDMVTLSSGMVCEAELKGSRARQQGPGSRSEIWTKLDKSLSSTTVSIITVLTAIVLIERDLHKLDGSRKGYPAAESLLTRLSITLLAIMEASDPQLANQGTYHQQSTVCFAILTSSLVLGVKHDGTERNQISCQRKAILEGLINIHGNGTSDGVHTVVEHAAAFLVDLSRCCGQSLHSDSQSCLESLVRQILEESQHGPETEKSFLKQWAVESSLHSAKTYATQRSRLFLDDIETAMAQQKPLSLQDPDCDANGSLEPFAEQSLCWEEGLCEWIVASPLRAMNSRVAAGSMHKRRSMTSSSESDMDDSGYLSEVERTPAHRQKNARMSDLLASPDMLGFNFGIPSYSDTSTRSETMEITAKGQKTMSNEQPLHPSPEFVLSEGGFHKSAAVFSNAAQVDETALEAEACSDVSHKDRFDKAERLVRKSKSQAAKQATPTKRCIYSTTAQKPSGLVQQISNKDLVSDLAENEIDELAMSCTKTCRDMSAASKGVTNKTVGRIALPTRRSSHLVDSSDDELGF
ncbi:hypothetical protein E4T38_01665 [Aureobasidium subglaciale]|nr:hypothetical protein E4T38_01665 [Aureobasidium subglaciale]KAI5222570.1 hypothetical protein E4T40_04882 [Aureobasidium subglaciale]KAI5233255.1 hypothetical protein E4T41_01663 [Aureobasidium subglaciale]KAI5262277.1 hypothetical protein E4T46_04594 [Aureobasidium subglaciale]